MGMRKRMKRVKKRKAEKKEDRKEEEGRVWKGEKDGERRVEIGEEGVSGNSASLYLCFPSSGGWEREKGKGKREKGKRKREKGGKAMAMSVRKSIMMVVSVWWMVKESEGRSSEERVYAICKGTTSPGVCYRTILPEVAGLAQFNIYKALEVEVVATQKEVQKTYDQILSLLGQAGNSKDTNDTLSDCKEQFEDMFDSIDDSIKLVAKRDAGEARFKFSAVLSYLASCTDDFTAPSPIAAQENIISDLGGNCLDIMKAIEDRDTRRHFPLTPLPSSPPSPCSHQVGLCS
ncbi:hypothetical protein VNO78_04439 [Psophocarpus tetragonolobus]|uniref:Pectinesterase inhibitor domain-containing protein n=1 Tax=Psophocarpus tetragonolobus TaxID=3891 RepID=A0AAN9XWT1_PSOTE